MSSDSAPVVVEEDEAVDLDDFVDDDPSSANSGVDKDLPPFLKKLSKMVNENRDYFVWREDGSLVVKDPDQLNAFLLPTYFASIKSCSFVRQLNMYGFHKIEDPTGTNPRHYEFRHPSFLPDNPDLLKRIQRRKTTKRNARSVEKSTPPAEKAKEKSKEVPSATESILAPASSLSDKNKSLLEAINKMQAQNEASSNSLMQMLNSFRSESRFASLGSSDSYVPAESVREQPRTRARPSTSMPDPAASQPAGLLQSPAPPVFRGMSVYANANIPVPASGLIPFLPYQQLPGPVTFLQYGNVTPYNMGHLKFTNESGASEQQALQQQQSLLAPSAGGGVADDDKLTSFLSGIPLVVSPGDPLPPAAPSTEAPFADNGTGEKFRYVKDLLADYYTTPTDASGTQEVSAIPSSPLAPVSPLYTAPSAHLFTNFPLQQHIIDNYTYPSNFTQPDGDNVHFAPHTCVSAPIVALLSNDNASTDAISSLNSDLTSIKLENEEGSSTATAAEEDNVVASLSQLLGLPPTPDTNFTVSADDLEQYMLNVRTPETV